MKNLFQLSLFLLILFQTALVSAHAVVTDHSLRISTISPNRPDKVELTFNSKIESGLSQVFLVRTGDKHELLTFTTDKQQGHIIIDIPALEPGKYALKFKVFAQDGHLTEDVIHFNVSPEGADPIKQEPIKSK